MYIICYQYENFIFPIFHFILKAKSPVSTPTIVRFIIQTSACRITASWQDYIWCGKWTHTQCRDPPAWNRDAYLIIPPYFRAINEKCPWTITALASGPSNVCGSVAALLGSSGSFLAEISVRSPRIFLIFIIFLKLDQSIEKNVLFNFENRSTVWRWRRSIYRCISLNWKRTLYCPNVRLEICRWGSYPKIPAQLGIQQWSLFSKSN